jgi:hypothetical protein
MTFDKDTPFFSVDDSDNALTTITDLGLIGQFPHYSGPDASHVSAILFERHRHHWLVACHFVGHTIKGVHSPYAVFGLLKQLYTREAVVAFMESLHRKLGGTGTPVFDCPKPDRN